MAAALDMTLPYVHERKQFRHAIGTFQLMQAKIADMYVSLTPRAPMSTRWAAPAMPAASTRQDAAAAILFAAERATQVALEAIQAWAATATSTTIRPAACCAMPSCTKSARAPGDSPHADRP